MYHFGGRIARRDGYYISMDVSRAAMVTIIEGRVMRRDRCMDRYVPHAFLDIAFHYIAHTYH